MFQKRELLRTITYNWRTLIGFEVLYKLLAAVIFVPLIRAVFDGVMRLSGYYYLTLENIVSFAVNWMTLVLFFIFAFLFSLVCAMDISAVIFVLDCSRRRKHVSIYQTIIFAFRNTCRVIKRKNVATLFLILLMIPFFNIGVVSSLGSTVSIPSFIRSYFQTHRRIIFACAAAWILLTVFLFRWIYTFHYFTLERLDFKEAAKRSRNLIRKEWIKDISFLLLVQALFYFCYFIFAVSGVLLVLIFGKIFSELGFINIMEASAIWGVIFVTCSIVFAVGTPVSFGCISFLFYRHKKKKQESMPDFHILSHPSEKSSRRRILAAQTGLFIIVMLGYSYLVYHSSAEKLDIQIEYLRTMEVTAHRGASMYYPENTMAAFQAAVEMGADWIELDVQQSRDGQIFVMHDRNFKRTTGVDKYSWELDYNQIRALDAGICFSTDYAGERIPLLRDVLEFARENDIRLNIELKPAGFETDFEKNVIDVICDMGFQDKCVVTSQQYETLKNVKEYCEDITTVYVMSLAYGNINRLKYADNFSVEAASVTPGMVSRVHNAGKQIYAWTINNRNAINRMIDLNVDNIITDNVTLAQKCIYESKTSDVIQKLVRFLRRR
ncbi:MAG: glycerophosphodiester phosphodiesterase family protein [Eubacteriales bacterium]|nr:glycerophosphodiester phosphodiesterase family protein [Eubacteriales bacterium]